MPPPPPPPPSLLSSPSLLSPPAPPRPFQPPQLAPLPSFPLCAHWPLGRKQLPEQSTELEREKAKRDAERDAEVGLVVEAGHSELAEPEESAAEEAREFVCSNKSRSGYYSVYPTQAGTWRAEVDRNKTEYFENKLDAARAVLQIIRKELERNKLSAEDQ
eukprot:2760174-Pleurochrysis_carterae.AAC.1